MKKPLFIPHYALRDDIERSRKAGDIERANRLQAILCQQESNSARTTKTSTHIIGVSATPQQPSAAI